MSAQQPPARLFIGSSAEGSAIASHLQDQLESRDICEVDSWQQIFEPSGYALPSLINAAASVDFAVLIATPDDTTTSRGERQFSVRDNIILEFGLFSGAIGLDRTYLLATGEVKLPSDILGMTRLPYRLRTDKNIAAALNSAVVAIENRVSTLGRLRRRGVGVATASEDAHLSAHWSQLQEAVQRFIGFDPASEPVGERLVNLRIAMIALIGDLHDWDGLDQWLEAERALGAVMGRQVLERSQRGDSIDRRLELLGPYQLWAQALSSNLRYLRSGGYDATALSELRRHAEEAAQSIYDANGWFPPTPDPRLRPLGG